MDLDFASVWERVTDELGDAEAIVAGDRRITYAAYDDAAARFAGAIEAMGVPEGAKVALYLYNSPEYLIAQYGAFKHRCVPVNVNYRYLDDELAYLIDNSDAEVVVYHRSLADRVSRVRDRLDRVRAWIEVDDGDGEPVEGALPFDEVLASASPQRRKPRSPRDLYMLYTGGTTGMPKGVMYDQHDFISRLYEPFAVLELPVKVPGSLDEVGPFARWMHDNARIVSVPCCPLMHGTGMWVGAMPAHISGGSVVLLANRSFDPDELSDLIEREAVTRVVIVGDAFARPILRALEAREAEGRLPDLSTVTHMISSGAMWSAEVKDGLLRYFPNMTIVDALGSTEGGGYGARESRRPGEGTTARFVPAPDTLLVDEAGRVITEVGVPGLLASRTPARGYYKDPDKTARTFTEIDGRWYVITGDWATREPDGTVTLHGRGSNCINTGGEKVYPEEVEEAIKTHPDVDDCLVVGLPDERFGQRVVAVVGTGGRALDADQLREHLRTRISGYKIPKQFVFVDTVRRAPNGKADYGWAREVAAAALAEPAR